MSCVSTIYFEQMHIVLIHSLSSTMLKNCVLTTTFCQRTLSTGNVHIQDIFTISKHAVKFYELSWNYNWVGNGEWDFFKSRANNISLKGEGVGNK